MAGDRAYQFVHHTEGGRQRMEALMKDDAEFCRKVVRAEERQTQRLAEVLERRDRSEAQRKRKVDDALPQQESGPWGGSVLTVVHHVPGKIVMKMVQWAFPKRHQRRWPAPVPVG